MPTWLTSLIAWLMAESQTGIVATLQSEWAAVVAAQGVFAKAVAMAKLLMTAAQAFSTLPTPTNEPLHAKAVADFRSHFAIAA